MFLDEVRALRATPFLVFDDTVFSEDAQITADLSLVTADTPGQVTDRVDIVSAEGLDEFTLDRVAILWTATLAG